MNVVLVSLHLFRTSKGVSEKLKMQFIIPLMCNYYHSVDKILECEHSSGCLPKILTNQIGHKIDFLQILYVN